MARGTHTRKRSGGPIRRPAKKSRVTRRRRSRRNGKSTTSRASNATSVGTFKGRKTSLRTYRNMLWRDTLMKSHYRSVFDTAFTLGTPNTTTGANVAQIIALPRFWEAGGGATFPANVGGTVPTFDGDIILRGGVCRIALANRVDALAAIQTDNVRCTVYAVWTTANPAALGLSNPVSTMWDPSLVPDFEKYGKVMWKREVLLKADGESVELFFKFKVQKIDQAVFGSALATIRGQSLMWLVHVSQLTNTEAAPTPENIDILVSHNVSFSSDAT